MKMSTEVIQGMTFTKMTSDIGDSYWIDAADWFYGWYGYGVACDYAAGKLQELIELVEVGGLEF